MLSEYRSHKSQALISAAAANSNSSVVVDGQKSAPFPKPFILMMDEISNGLNCSAQIDVSVSHGTNFFDDSAYEANQTDHFTPKLEVLEEQGDSMVEEYQIGFNELRESENPSLALSVDAQMEANQQQQQDDETSKRIVNLKVISILNSKFEIVAHLFMPVVGSFGHHSQGWGVAPEIRNDKCEMTGTDL